MSGRDASGSSSSAPTAAPTRTCSPTSSPPTASAARSSRSTTCSGGAESLICLETLRPDVAKIDRILTAGIQHSTGRRRLVAALVECAHEQGCRVVAEGIERDSEFEVMRDLGVDLGQGFYFGQPTARPMAVDPRLVLPRLTAPSEAGFQDSRRPTLGAGGRSPVSH